MATTLEDVQKIATPFKGETLAIAKEKPASIDDMIKDMSLDELLELRAKITDLLPEMSLSAVNLEQELLLQYRTVKALQTRVHDSGEVPANQLAQVANTISSTLDRLTKMQGEMYSNERFKRIELAMIRMLKEWPEKMTKKFFKEYEEILGDT